MWFKVETFESHADSGLLEGVKIEISYRGNQSCWGGWLNPNKTLGTEDQMSSLVGNTLCALSHIDAKRVSSPDSTGRGQLGAPGLVPSWPVCVFPFGLFYSLSLPCNKLWPWVQQLWVSSLSPSSKLSNLRIPNCNWCQKWGCLVWIVLLSPYSQPILSPLHFLSKITAANDSVFPGTLKRRF